MSSEQIRLKIRTCENEIDALKKDLVNVKEDLENAENQSRKLNSIDQTMKTYVENERTRTKNIDSMSNNIKFLSNMRAVSQSLTGGTACNNAKQSMEEGKNKLESLQSMLSEKMEDLKKQIIGKESKLDSLRWELKGAVASEMSKV